MDNIEELTPVKERTAFLKWYWNELDAIHANQVPATGSLWGLVEGKRDKVFDHQWLPLQRELYRKFLIADLIAEIERLWGTSLLKKYPNRIVTEPFPHMMMAKAMGPALEFWHGVSLTAWFLTQGPHAVTDMSGLAEYQRKNLSQLEQLGVPINPRMFDELIEPVCS